MLISLYNINSPRTRSRKRFHKRYGICMGMAGSRFSFKLYDFFSTVYDFTSRVILILIQNNTQGYAKVLKELLFDQ